MESECITLFVFSPFFGCVAPCKKNMGYAHSTDLLLCGSLSLYSLIRLHRSPLFEALSPYILYPNPADWGLEASENLFP